MIRPKTTRLARRASTIPAAILGFLSGCLLPTAIQAQTPVDSSMVEVQCGVVYSLSATPTYGAWVTEVESAFGSRYIWSHLLMFSYSPFVVVKNLTPNALIFDKTSGHLPEVRFNQPELGLRFQRLGNYRPGFVTTQAIPIDRYYYAPHAEGKEFVISLFGDESANPASDAMTLQAGETRVFSPLHPYQTFQNSFDWQNNLTENLKAAPTWKSLGHGYYVDWLTTRTYNNPGVNENFGIIPTTLTSEWNVEVSRTGETPDCRIFRYPSQLPPAWPAAQNEADEVNELPFIANTAPIKTYEIDAPQTLPIAEWPVRPLFSVLLPPKLLRLELAAQVSNPDADDDGDGHSNYFEHVAGTSPANAADQLRPRMGVLESGEPELKWAAVPGKSYAIEASPDLKTWAESSRITATSDACSFSTPPGDGSPRFFRLRPIP